MALAGRRSPEALPASSPPRGRSDASGASAAARLDLHEGISDPARRGCQRWPEELRLVSSLGEVVRGRCRATNLCPYCARLFAVETSEMLALDALDGEAPALWLVLTTRTPDTEPASFYRARERVVKALRRRWTGCEYAALVEMTTGYGPRSGGLRRPHWNVLLKRVPVLALGEVEALVRRVWCDRVDAEPWAQFVGAVSEVGGLMRYVALHFLKESQAPPVGWRGHRFVASRGYFAGGRTPARARARESLREKRELHRALAAGLDGEAAEAFVAYDERRFAAFDQPQERPAPGSEVVPAT
jgi:hypothetical protein